MSDKFFMWLWISLGALDLIVLGTHMEASKPRECVIDLLSVLGCVAFALRQYLRLTA